MTDVPPTERAVRRRVLQKGRWLPIVVGTLTAGILSAVAWFGLGFFRDSAYEDERAFRILGHIVGQFGNFQGAVAGALKVVPTRTYLPVLNSELTTESLTNEQDMEDQRNRNARDSESKQYQNALAFRDVTLSVDALSPKSPEIAVFRIDAQRHFSMSRKCSDKRNEKDCQRVVPALLTLSGPLAEQLPTFFFQDFFDSVIIASEKGVTLASIPRWQDRGNQLALHDVATVDPLGGDAAELLRRAAQHIATSAGAEHLGNQGDKGSSVAAPAGALPGFATVFNDNVSGQSVRVFVLPFVPAHATTVEDKKARQLYLIALKQQRLLGALNEALGSGGALAVTLCVVFGVLAWPLLSLRFESSQEGISQLQVFAVLMSLLLLPAVISTAGFSLWTRYRLMLWADTHAELYARRVEQVLIDELDEGVHVLEQLRRDYAPFAPFTAESVKRTLERNKEIGPTRIDELLADGNVVCVKSDSDCLPPQTWHRGKGICVRPGSDCLAPIEWYRSPRAPDNWSPIRSAAPLNVDGTSVGLTLSYFAPALITRLDVHDREYFQAVMQHEEWRTNALWEDAFIQPSAHAHRFVAQRLFNRTDAARVLQIAIPMDDKDGKRLGIVTGDTRVYGLTQAMRPPLLRFAVVDTRDGSVLFHSRERLSLAENLLVETEHNPSLEAAMQRRASLWSRYRVLPEDHFAGRYLAAPHRFLFRPVAGAPWGIVVFYPTGGVNDMVVQTAVATLSTYFAAVIVLTLVLALLVLALPERADRVLLKRIWPKWQSRALYRTAANAGVLALFVIAVALVGRLARFPWWQIAGALVIAGMLVWGVERLRARWRPTVGPPSLTAYKRSYVQCIFCVLMLASAVPSVLLAIDYHDTSVAAVIRDELDDALGDEEQRRHTLTRDQQRFTGAGLTADAAADRSRRLPLPGYRAPATDDARRTWLVRDVEPTPWLAKCGPRPLNKIRHLIWSLSTARQVQRPLAQTQVTESSQPGRKDDVGCEDPIIVRAWLRSEDGIRSSAGYPRRPLEGDLGKPQRCSSEPFQRGPGLCRDENLAVLYATGTLLMPLAFGLFGILLITLMSALAARRLFGIRIPFTARFTPSEADQRDVSQLLDAELDLLELKKKDPMTSKDEADWRAVKCRHIYQRMWDALGTDEQFLVHQLARGQFANPENQPVIERLLRRGYLTLAPWPRIVEPGFAEFVRIVATDESFDRLRYDATHTLWSQLRTPLLVLVVIVAVLLMWLAGSAMHLIAATLAGVAGLFGSIQRVTSFLHRDKPPAEVS
jgi:hypothetical protein